MKKVVYRANKLRPTVTPAATGLLMLTSLCWKMHGEWKRQIKINCYLIVIASTKPTMYLHSIFVVSLFDWISNDANVSSENSVVVGGQFIVDLSDTQFWSTH